MKSFLSASGHFIIALTITATMAIYVGLNQHSAPPIVTVTPSPNPLLPHPPEILIPTPSANQIDSGNVSKNNDLPLTSPSNPLITTKSSLTEIPTHFSYREENSKNLVEIGVYFDRVAYLSRDAAKAFKQMQLDAKKQGIELAPISGFRSIADQEKLFQRQIQRQGSPKAAERLSAPPGFSEHHTGYAMDISDGNNHDTDLKVAFDSTDAYHWLQTYAGQYGFELSFPKNNSQGVSYEPWHWRFVGSPIAKEIFQAARTEPNR